MKGHNLKLLITDFDGTLVDTFRANYLAYRQAFSDVGRDLSEETYSACFGFRFERFMDAASIEDNDIRSRIKELKATYYPSFFSELKVNKPLLEMLKAFRQAGGKTAIASTARRKNLENALRYIGAIDAFDLILAGEEVKDGKPSPEIYLTVLSYFGIQPSDALVFEDSDVGIKSAEAAGINYIIINSNYYAD